MAKDNEFIEGLQDQVIGADTLENKREKLLKEIEEMESNVIKDPRALENLKKELAAVEKQIKKEQSEKDVEQGNVVAEAEQDMDEDKKKEKKEEQEEEKKETVKDEQDLNEKEQEEQAKEAAEQAKATYHKALVDLHELKIANIAKQISSHELVMNDSDYEQELKLEAEMYVARDAYLALGYEDPYTELRTEYIKKEKEAREPIELELRNRAKRYREIEEEIKKIDKREQEINDELLNKDLNETQIDALNKELEELGQKRKKLEVELADIKDKLDHAIETRRERLIARSGLEQKHVETLTYEDKKNYDYQQEKVSEMNNNFDQATKLHYNNVKKRIEEREQKIKDINKQLKEVEPTDFEKRLLLLNELDKETHMLEADKELKRDLDRGIVPNKEEMKKDAYEKVDEEEYRQKEFNKATDDTREVIEEQQEILGKQVVENPEKVNKEEQDRDTTLKAATVAMIVDDPTKPGPDDLGDDVKQFVVAKCVISGLEGQVRNPDDLEDAKAIVAQDRQIKEAQQELEKVQKNIEQKAQTV